ncbi:MAG: hypothetical protein EOM50_10390 [Erysipelotrichia bacterium]|nr:hypothetical protein [Erysipelotrichia bacterium]
MKILCYGDSNTWGHNPENANRFDETQRWPKILQTMLNGKCEVIEEGLCGRCASFVDSVKPYRHGISMLTATLEIHQPIDLVILMLGTNDLKKCFSPSAVAIANGIKAMVQIIKNKYTYNPHMQVPKILIVAPIHLHESYYTMQRTSEQFNEQSYETGKKLAFYYEEIAKQYDCMFLDASKYAKASSIDGIHMDKNNHKKLAKAIYEKLVKC